MNIYVGNLSFDVTEDDLRSAFEAFGKVDTVNIIKDRESGRPKGFGFVEMSSGEEAKQSITAALDRMASSLSLILASESIS